ncbi:hypothetical protein SMA90_33675, partial [Escherichia coli]
ETVPEPTPTFTWNPVGEIDFNDSPIKRGDSDLYIFDRTTDSIVWWPGFEDTTTDSATYNSDGTAASLVSGHEYEWNSWAYGYDEDG